MDLFSGGGGRRIEVQGQTGKSLKPCVKNKPKEQI
jgi:hypothetical protein